MFILLTKSGARLRKKSDHIATVVIPLTLPSPRRGEGGDVEAALSSPRRGEESA